MNPLPRGSSSPDDATEDPLETELDPSKRVVHQFEFSGTADAYFQIWIVNMMLSVVTLGIYSAWAKVRTKNYFYRHTRLDGSAFEYLADPIKILKGRLLVGGFFIAWVVAERFSTGWYVGLSLVFVLMTPAILVLAMRFNTKNSVYRNVRFVFHGTMKASYVANVIAMFASLLTLGLGGPFAQWKIADFVIANVAHGTNRFEFRASIAQFYKVFATSLLCFIPLAFLSAAIGIALWSDMSEGSSTTVLIVVGVFGWFAMFYISTIVAAGYINAKLANVILNGISFGAHRLESDQKPAELIWLYLSNAVCVAVSSGLLLPWAMVRLHRYRTSHLRVHAVGDLLSETDSSAQGGGVVGDAAVDLGGLDLGLGA